MVSWNINSSKVRQGLAKCSSCGGFYDPTYGPCPCKRKRFYCLAAIIILFLLLLPARIGAQVDATPTPECFWQDGQWLCISHIEATVTPFVPTATPVPPTVAPTPTIVIMPLPKRYVYLALLYR